MGGNVKQQVLQMRRALAEFTQTGKKENYILYSISGIRQNTQSSFCLKPTQNTDIDLRVGQIYTFLCVTSSGVRPMAGSVFAMEGKERDFVIIIHSTTFIGRNKHGVVRFGIR